MRLSRPAVLGEAVHRHGIEGSPRIRHQAEEGGEDEGDPRTGLSRYLNKPLLNLLLLSITSNYNLILIRPAGSLYKLSQLSSLGVRSLVLGKIWHTGNYVFLYLHLVWTEQ